MHVVSPNKLNKVCKESLTSAAAKGESDEPKEPWHNHRKQRGGIDSVDQQHCDQRPGRCRLPMRDLFKCNWQGKHLYHNGRRLLS